MAERASMPTFVPRTVASFERAATVVARRVAAPVRMLATRALSFADRLVGNWTSGGTSSGAIEGGARTMRAATRGGDMLMPRPWYEVDADEDAIWPQQAARSAAVSAARGADVPTATAAAAAAERGAAIARTTLTAAPDVVARAIDAARDERAGAPATSAVAEDVRAAEALGLRAAAAPIALATATPAATWAPAPRATTPLGRALAHAAWVDAQLRTVAAPVETAPRGSGGYVFVAPADVERTAEGAREAATAAAARQVAAATATPATTAASASPMMAAMVPSATTATAMAPGARGASDAAAMAGWSAALPDPRLPATMPTAIAQRMADFVARLVGVQSARDVAPVEAAVVPVAVHGAATTVEARPAAERTFVVLAPPAPPASWRPGAAAARVEQLGARVDARVSAAWGEPATVPMATGGAIERGVATGAFLPSSAATSSAMTTVPAPTARAAAERIYVAPVDVSARATGPARLSQFLQQLLGVQAARATAPLPVQALIAMQAAATEPPATTSATAATTTAAPRATAPAMAASGRAPARVTLAATTTTTAPTSESNAIAAPTTAASQIAQINAASTMAPGAIGRRAEQLGGLVGVRAASLSIDFVDPARLSLLSAAPPSMPTVTPTADSVARDTIMPPPQPLFAPAPSIAAPTLTAEEWSLVATFPSAATAVQLATARQAAQWSGGTATARAAAAPVRTMLAATAADRAVDRGTDGVAIARTSVAGSAARGGAPTEYVVPTVAARETQGRLPGGRTPRGSFTWPKIADYVPSRAEWTAPVAVALAEQTRQLAPGTPLWGALPALIAVSPSLAASGFGNAADTATSAGGGLAPSLAGARELVSGAAASTAARDAAMWPTAAGGAAPGNASAHDAGARSRGLVEATSMREVATATRDASGGDAGAAAGTTRPDAPAMTLMTAAATREARAAARMGARDAGDSDAGGDERGLRADGRAPMPLAPGADPTRATVAVSNVRPAAAMPLMTAGPTARDGVGRAAVGPTARALELARPFLRLVEGGITGDAGAQRASGAPRFFEEPQPVVAGAPSSDSASRIVEALRSQPAAASSDDRVSLADLTLIAIASATQQVAASAQGGGPSSSSAAAAPSAAAPAAEAAQGGKSGNPTQEIEELARAAFDELQRLFAMARERSGDHG